MLKCPRIQRILLKDVNGSAAGDPPAGSSSVVHDVLNGGVVHCLSENGQCGDVPNIDSTTPAELCSVDLVNVSLHFQQNWNAILRKLIDILDMQERPVCVDEDRRQCTTVSGVVKSFAKSFSRMKVSHVGGFGSKYLKRRLRRRALPTLGRCPRNKSRIYLWRKGDAASGFCGVELHGVADILVALVKNGLRQNGSMKTL